MALILDFQLILHLSSKSGKLMLSGLQDATYNQRLNMRINFNKLNGALNVCQRRIPFEMVNDAYGLERVNTLSNNKLFSYQSSNMFRIIVTDRLVRSTGILEVKPIMGTNSSGDKVGLPSALPKVNHRLVEDDVLQDEINQVLISSIKVIWMKVNVNHNDKNKGLANQSTNTAMSPTANTSAFDVSSVSSWGMQTPDHDQSSMYKESLPQIENAPSDEICVATNSKNISKCHNQILNRKQRKESFIPFLFKHCEWPDGMKKSKKRKKCEKYSDEMKKLVMKRFPPYRRYDVDFLELMNSC